MDDGKLARAMNEIINIDREHFGGISNDDASGVHLTLMTVESLTVS